MQYERHSEGEAPNENEEMDNVRHRYAPHATGHGVNYENRAADEDGELC